VLGFDKEKLKLDHVFGSIILGYLLCRYVFGATHDPMQVILEASGSWYKQMEKTNAAEREGTKKGNQDFLLWENQRKYRQNFGYTFLKE
jgi:hypothetical protein